MIRILRGDDTFPCGRCGAWLYLDLPLTTAAAAMLSTALATVALTSGTRWFIAACLAWLTLFPWMTLLLTRWRVERAGPRHCPACDYDLAGNTTGICPECGKLYRP